MKTCSYMRQSIQKWMKKTLWKTAVKQFEVMCSASADRITSNFFTGCLPQILLGPFLNTLPHIRYFKFEPSFKLRWCRAEDFSGFELQIVLHSYNSYPIKLRWCCAQDLSWIINCTILYNLRAKSPSTFET